MGCMGSKTDLNHPPTAVRGCTDVFWLCLYVAFWLLMIVVAIFSFVYGNPLRLTNGYDSFGNTCGVKYNERYTNFPLSGLNTIDKPHLFFLDVKELRETIKICVKQCPTIQITNRNELYKYYVDTQTKLCRYDFNMSLLLERERNDVKYFDLLGPCPPFPVYESTPVLHRCVPQKSQKIGEDRIRGVYDLLNKWDVAQQFLGDLQTTWPVILLLAVLALVFSLILIALMHWLTKIVSWLICIFVAVTSVALTTVLWWTYYQIKHKHELNVKYSLLEEFVRNETGVFVLAIIFTILMVKLIKKKKKK